MDGTLVHEGVFYVQLQVLVEEIVGTYFVVGLARAHLFLVAIECKNGAVGHRVEFISRLACIGSQAMLTCGPTKEGVTVFGRY